jgi:hypothetical protein
MLVRASQVTSSFFCPKRDNPVFPQNYFRIWEQEHSRSEIAKIKALLRDYTKDSYWLGSFLGRVFSGHWNRHYIDKVRRIIQTTYESTDHLLYDLKLIKPSLGGSLDARIRFIDEQRAAARPEDGFARSLVYTQDHSKS